jgi:hypothetical protein
MSEPEGGGNEGGGFLGPTSGPLETGLSVGGRVSQAGDGLGAVGTAISGANAYSHIAPFGGTLFDAFTNGSHALEEGESVLGGAGKALGPLGQVFGGVSAVGHGVQVANDISREGAAAAYHDPEAYTHAGGAALGAAHALLPFAGPYGEAANLALTGGELAADAGGALAGKAFGKDAGFSADSVAGGLIRGTFGDQSPGEQARQGVGNLLGHGTAANILGGAADIGVNVANLPGSLATTVGRGIFSEGEAIGSGIANGQGVVGHALNTAGHAVADGVGAAGTWAGNTASAAGTGIANGWNATQQWAGNTASTIGTGLGAAGTWAGNTASTVGNGLANGASAAGTWAGHTASTVGNGLANGAGAVGHALTHNPVANAVGSVLSW